MNRKQKRLFIRVLCSFLLLVGLEIVFRLTQAPNDLRFLCYLIPYLLIGYDILKKAGKSILNRQAFDENFLMAVATVGAIALGDFREGAAVMLFYQIGELFQSYAVGKSRRNISALMDIRPDTANLETEHGTIRVDPNEVSVGSVIQVLPGEKVPIDGVVVEGNSSVNTAALTGESLPRDVGVHSEIISGCVNQSGLLRIRTTKTFGESTVSKILDLVENSGARKSKSENFISKFARVYTPTVCILALALALLPPFVLFLLGKDPAFTDWLYRGLTFLVISCPCALVISVPLSFFAGIGGASRAGILIKGSNYMETLSRVKYVLFDKTGTLTRGVFEVVGIHHNRLEEEEILKIAAHVEGHSTHPIARSIVKAYGKALNPRLVSEVEEISGYGITAKVAGQFVAIGNAGLMEERGVAYHECHQSGTVVHVAIDGAYAGHILISDVIKPTSATAIAALKRCGVKKCVMLTGDGKRVASQVADALGIEEYYSELLPADKVTRVEEQLHEKPEKDVLAFVGDGINDAPVLMRADLGIAMGALGSDAAIEAADVVLMDDDPLRISKAIEIAKKCMRIVYENIYFAIGVKISCLILGAFGITNMWIAIFADVGVTVIAVLNAIRALKIK